MPEIARMKVFTFRAFCSKASSPLPPRFAEQALGFQTEMKYNLPTFQNLLSIFPENIFEILYSFSERLTLQKKVFKNFHRNTLPGSLMFPQRGDFLWKLFLFIFFQKHKFYVWFMTIFLTNLEILKKSWWEGWTMVLQLLNLLSFTQIFSSLLHAYIDLYMRDKS